MISLLSQLFHNNSKRPNVQTKHKRKPAPKLLHLARQNKWNAFIKRCQTHPEDASYYDKKCDPDFQMGYVLHHILRMGQKKAERYEIGNGNGTMNIRCGHEYPTEMYVDQGSVVQCV